MTPSFVSCCVCTRDGEVSKLQEKHSRCGNSRFAMYYCPLMDEVLHGVYNCLAVLILNLPPEFREHVLLPKIEGLFLSISKLKNVWKVFFTYFTKCNQINRTGMKLYSSCL